MCKDVLLRPPLEIKQDTMRQEFEASLRQFLASLASQHRVEAATQGVQVHNVGGGIAKFSSVRAPAPQSELCCCLDKSMFSRSLHRSRKPCRSANVRASRDATLVQ